MEKKLVEKMIKNCFKQYYEAESLPLSVQELEVLTNRILQLKETDSTEAVYEIVNDVVYEFLTR